MTTAPPEGEDRNFVTALARGLEVLRCFRPNEARLSNHDIAARTGLPKPTISRLTYTLRRLGYLEQSERNGAYRLGAGVLALGYGVLAGMEMGDRASEEMRALCDGPNPHITAALAERHRLKAVYMAARRARHAVALSMEVGARLPLFQSAIGRAILVAMDPGARDHLARLAIREKPELEEGVRGGIEKALADYARYGLCTGFGDWRVEVNGIAAPVVSLDGERLYGLNIGGPSFLVSPEELLRDYAEPLKRAAAALGGPAAP